MDIGSRLKNEKRRWVLLPVEVKARAFESKILLACFAAEAGYGAILGQRAFRGRLSELPRGVCVSKGVCPNGVETLRQWKEMGFSLVYLDEEGLVYPNRATYARTRVSAEILDSISLFMAWGDDQAEAVTSRFEAAEGKMVVTGNPRADLWRPEIREIYRSRADKLRARLGRYVLMPSSFSEAISANGPDFRINQARKLGLISTSEEEKSFRERIAHKKRLFREFTAAVPELAKAFPDTTFVIRPHPGDDHERWCDTANAAANVVVEFDDSISPWILGAVAVLHNGCTSGIETYAMGGVPVAYMPHTNVQYDMHLPNALSLQARDVTSLKTLLRSIIVDGEHPVSPCADSVAHQHIAGLEEDFASERIVKALGRLDWPEADLNYSPEKRSLASRAVGKCKGALARLSSKPLLAHDGVIQVRETYMRQKFPGSSLKEVEDLIAQFREFSGRFQNVDVYELDRHLYCFLRSP